MKNNNSQKVYLEWILKAQEDEKAGNAIMDRAEVFAPACFHFQQMAEKYLKGLLVFYGKDFPKVHDLIELETLLLADCPQVEGLHDELKLLNRYYVETRYPGDYPDFTQKDAKEAFSAAKKVRDFIIEKIIPKP